MIYVAIDLETTGVDPEKNDILEFGAVIEDMQTPIENLPRFRKYILKKEYVGQPVALSMNKNIIDILAQYDPKLPMDQQKYEYCNDYDLIATFIKWLIQYEIITNEDWPEYFTVAGKNFATFDWRFIKKLSYGNKLHISPRVIDPAILYFNPFTDLKLPDTATCLERAGFPVVLEHTTIEDSLDIIKLVRKFYNIPL